jgi:DNA polymerase-1
MKKKVTKEEWLASVINNIKEEKGKVRQMAKSPFFALNYKGTYRTLMKNLGFTEKKAKFIEKSHKELYKVYYSHVDNRLNKAKTDGYVTLAFGLRLRTPLLTDKDAPEYKKEQENRSAGNAMFQSYGLITLRSFARFMERVWNHKEYYYQILPVVTIYDSIYLDVPNDIDCLHWVNENLIECMKSMDGCEELEHPKIALGADLEVLFPSWAHKYSIPNKASKEEILDILS